MKRRTKSTHRRRPVNIKGMMLMRILKAALFGCVVTVVAVLALALILKWNVLQENGIAIATSAVKALSAGFVGLLCANGLEKRGWMWGGIAGCTYILLAFAAFAIIEKAFAFNFGLLADIIMGFVAGAAGSMLLRIRRNC